MSTHSGSHGGIEEKRIRATEAQTKKDDFRNIQHLKRMPKWPRFPLRRPSIVLSKSTEIQTDFITIRCRVSVISVPLWFRNFGSGRRPGWVSR